MALPAKKMFPVMYSYEEVVQVLVSARSQDEAKQFVYDYLEENGVQDIAREKRFGEWETLDRDYSTWK